MPNVPDGDQLILIAMGNSADATLVPEVERLIGDDSSLVRGAAVWALGRLDRARLAHIAPARWPFENDPQVREEWTAMLEDVTHTGEPVRHKDLVI